MKSIQKDVWHGVKLSVIVPKKNTLFFEFQTVRSLGSNVSDRCLYLVCRLVFRHSFKSESFFISRSRWRYVEKGALLKRWSLVAAEWFFKNCNSGNFRANWTINGGVAFSLSYSWASLLRRIRRRVFWAVVFRDGAAICSRIVSCFFVGISLDENNYFLEAPENF